ncbi:MAG: cupin domain-containing protein [Deltaproteobacteria bacterium]|nr:cupin domain-containing protein [Deltaproteobacteria bacterium]
MVQDIDIAAEELALGVLSLQEREALEAAARKDPSVARALRSAEARVHALGLLARPVAPPAALRARVLAAVAADGRFGRFVDRVAAILDVTMDRARDLLRGIDDPKSWADGGADGCDLFHLEGGPGALRAVCGFVRLRPGATFPDHEHVGLETVLVVQGAFVDSLGARVETGTQVEMVGGTKHSLTALPGPDLIYLARIYDGVIIGGELMAPGDPRI